MEGSDALCEKLGYFSFIRGLLPRRRSSKICVHDLLDQLYDAKLVLLSLFI